MLPIRTVLHPTDFSDRSANAFHLACSLAHDYGARLLVLHVVHEPPVIFGEEAIAGDPADTRADARAELDRLQPSQLHVMMDRRLEDGSPPAVILRVAEEVRADVIVMGTHGRTGLARLLMGSVAEEVVRQSRCPVLTATSPPKSPSAEPAAGRRDLELQPA